jgi:hypothetical protein
MVVCRCDCGYEASVRYRALVSGESKGCRSCREIHADDESGGDAEDIYQQRRRGIEATGFPPCRCSLAWRQTLPGRFEREGDFIVRARNDGHSLRCVGKIVGMSPEWVRQVEMDARQRIVARLETGDRPEWLERAHEGGRRIAEAEGVEFAEATP